MRQLCLTGGWEILQTGGRGEGGIGTGGKTCPGPPPRLPHDPPSPHKPPTLPGTLEQTLTAQAGSSPLRHPHPSAPTHENTQVFMGPLLAVKGANYMVQATLETRLSHRLWEPLEKC